MKKLICDFDDVICNNRIVELANEFLGTQYKFEDVGEGYDFSKLVTDKQQLFKLYEYLVKNNFYNGATLKPDCYDVLKELQDDFGYEIYICSACIVVGFEHLSGIVFKDKFDYIHKVLPFVNPKNIIFTNAKGVVQGDVIIDDRLVNLNSNFNVKLLFDCWYNKKYSKEELDAQNVQRVKNWKDIKQILMEDYRYVTKEESRDFHRKRRAFVIYKGELSFIDEGSDMSHWEFCTNQFPDITKDKFNNITRGYYLDGNLVFYKDNFCYDDALINEALKFVPEIKEKLGVSNVKINFGLKVGKPGENWPMNYYYGESLKNNKIEKN